MDEGEKTSHANTKQQHTQTTLSPFLPSHIMCVLHTGHCNKHACTCTVCMIMHSGGEDEKKKGGCVWHSSTARHSGWLAGNQRDSSMSKKGAYLPLPPPLISSAWTCSGNTSHTCSHADSLSLPHSLSSLGLAQVESMLSS